MNAGEVMEMIRQYGVDASRHQLGLHGLADIRAAITGLLAGERERAAKIAWDHQCDAATCQCQQHIAAAIRGQTP